MGKLEWEENVEKKENKVGDDNRGMRTRREEISFPSLSAQVNLSFFNNPPPPTLSPVLTPHVASAIESSLFSRRC